MREEINLNTIQQYDIVTNDITICCVIGVVNNMLLVEPVIRIRTLELNTGEMGAKDLKFFIPDVENTYKPIITSDRYWGYPLMEENYKLIRKQNGKRPRKETFIKLAKTLKYQNDNIHK
jgi:hypothetical protein